MKNSINSLGYKLGTLLVTTGVICLSAVVIALTIKFILWMF